MTLLKFFLLTATIIAADQSSFEDTANKASAFQTHACNHYDKSLLPTPTYITYPPPKEKIRLDQLFASDTGHPEIDDRAFDLTRLLLDDGNKDRIKQFRSLSEDVQVSAAADVFKLACKNTISDEEFKKKM